MILEIPGEPQAKMRHRMTKRGHSYNPQSEVERSIQWEIRRQLPDGYEPTKQPLILEIEAHFPRPKSHYGSGRNANLLKPSAPGRHTKKPDADNISKIYKDCMNKLVYLDDSQVFDGRCIKHYCDKNEPGRVIIRIREDEKAR